MLLRSELPTPELVLLRGLDRRAADEVLAAATRRVLRPGDRLFGQGDPVDALFAIESGTLRISHLTAEGEVIAVQYVGRGAIVSGFAMLEPRLQAVSADAVGESRVLAWTRSRIQALAVRHPTLGLNVLRTIADRLQDSLVRIRELSTESAAHRVAHALYELARDSQPSGAAGSVVDLQLGRKDLAQLAGASMFTASRLVAAWARAGILEVGRHRISIRSLSRLAALAGEPADP